MDAESIKEVERLIKLGQAQVIGQVPGTRIGEFLVRNGEGMIDIKLPTLTRETECLNLASLAEFCADANCAEVWLNTSGLVARTATGTYRARLPLRMTPPAQLLMSWQNINVSYEQAGFYKALRTVLAGAYNAHPELKRIISKMDFKKIQESSQTIARAGVSMSRSMQAEASGVSELPEVAIFYAPLWELFPEIKVTVPVHLEVNAAAERIEVYVRADDLAAQVTGALATLERMTRTALEEANASALVFLGTTD